MSQRPKSLIANSLIAAALLVALPASAKQSTKDTPKKDPAAVLAVVSGNVNVLRGDTKVDGSFGASLQPGDIVETGAGAQAAVLFDSGQIIELGPGSRITIGSVPAKAGDGPVMAQVPDALSGSLNRFARSADGAEGISYTADLRKSENDVTTPEQLSPRLTLIAPGAVIFTWMEVEGALEYRLHVAGSGKGAGTYTSTAASWTAPKDAFKPGELYTWKVEAVTAEGTFESLKDVDFKIASADQWGEITALTGRLDPLVTSEDATRRDTAAYLLGSYCRSAGFYADAIREIEGLSKRYPERKELHAELGFLYEQIQRYDLAVQEYKLAGK